MKVAAIQMVSTTTVATNLATATRLLREAAAHGAELAVLPEYFCLLGRKDTDKLEVREPFGSGPIQDCMSALARELGIWIGAGTLPLATPDLGRVRNSLLVFAPDASCVARYDKIHLFRYDNGQERYDESRVLAPGDKLVAFDLPSRDGKVWRIGLSVCYDLRFPELYRDLRADLLLAPSAFTYGTGEAHWQLLVRTRAVENQAFLMAPAQGGLHENGRRTWGHSVVVDPWGEVLDQRAQGEGLVLANLDPARLALVRRQLPALEHRVL